MAWDILTGRLIQGSVLDAALVQADIVITCSPESEMVSELGDVLRNRTLHVLFPFEDTDALPDMTLARAIASLAAHQIGLGRTVLAHCTQGCNRSGLMCGLILFALGYPASGLVAQIQAAHPQALYNATFRDALSALRRDA